MAQRRLSDGTCRLTFPDGGHQKPFTPSALARKVREVLDEDTAT